MKTIHHFYLRKTHRNVRELSHIFYFFKITILQKTQNTLFFSLLIFISCMNSEIDEYDDIFLNIYMNSEMIENVYQVKYNSSKSHSYTSVYYKTNGLRLVEWFSDDEFCVEFMNDVICNPIVNYSTYSRDDGTGKQIVRLEQSQIGEILNVRGCINDTCDEIYFTIIQ